MVVKATPTAYHLRHPELDVPATAEYRGFWRQNGRVIGLALRFLGEHHDRKLTYAEIEALQGEEVDTPAIS